MIVAEVRGKSTKKIRRAYVLIDDVMAEGIEFLMNGNSPTDCNYIFAR